MPTTWILLIDAGFGKNSETRVTIDIIIYRIK